MALPKVLEAKFAQMQAQNKHSDVDDSIVIGDDDQEEDTLANNTINPDDESRLTQFLSDDDDDDIEEDKPKLRVVQDDTEDDIDPTATLDSFFKPKEEASKDTDHSLQVLMNEVKDLKSQLKDAHKQSRANTNTNIAADLSTDELTTYKAAIPVIEKVATAIASRIINERMSDLLGEAITPVRNEFESKVNTLRSDLSNMSERTFFSQIRQSISDVDRLIKTKKFVQGSAAIEPTTGKSYGQLMNEAYIARNVGAFVNIIEILRPEQKKAPRRRNKASTNAQVKSGESRHKFTTSDYIRMINKLSRGQITQENMNKFLESYNKAKKQNLVHDDIGQQ